MVKKENTTHTDLSTCPICFEQLSNPHYYVPCRHIFCYNCISAWEGEACPLCRKKISSYQQVKTAPSSGDEGALILISDNVKSLHIYFKQLNWSVKGLPVIYMILL